MSNTLSEVLGPVALRRFDLLEVCQENQGHAHNYDHVTFVVRGAVKVFYRLPDEAEERESPVFRAGDERPYFLVKKDVHHRIKAVEPNTRYACVFAHHDHDGAAVQEYAGNEASYV